MKNEEDPKVFWSYNQYSFEIKKIEVDDLVDYD